MNAHDVLKGLRKRHISQRGRLGDEWAFFPELRVGTGYAAYRDKKKGKNVEQRMDAWAMNLYPSKKYHRICYEIKVSRSDFMHEIKNPDKRKQGLELSNQFYFVTPPGLVKKEEIPLECGLIEVKEDGSSKVIVQAPMRECAPPPIHLVMSIMRRAMEYEEKSRSLDEYIKKARDEGRLIYDWEMKKI